jgi:hypothetical protein
MQLWTLLLPSSHSRKEPNQTIIIRTKIQVYIYLQTIFSIIRTPIPKGHFGIVFQGVKSSFGFKKEKVRVIGVKQQ